MKKVILAMAVLAASACTQLDSITGKVNQATSAVNQASSAVNSVKSIAK
ncbi:hypothetical protein [Rodentibacter trehalosifermentans]|nr:hypothetical protein [Rodentibacter trehalosifermentans]